MSVELVNFEQQVRNWRGYGGVERVDTTSALRGDLVGMSQ
jgi:hypothetical protein